MNFVDPDFIDPDSVSNPDEAPKGASSSNTLSKNAGGFGALPLDMGLGMVKMIGALPLTAAAKVMSPSHNLDELWKASNDLIADALPGSAASSIGVDKSTLYKGGMYPFEKLGEGIEKVGDVVSDVTGSKDAGGGFKIAANFAPIPGAKIAGKALGKGADKIRTTLSEHRGPKTNIKDFIDPDVVKTEMPEQYAHITGDTKLQKQLALGEEMAKQEQTFADKNNIQGELDLRPKEMPVDENGIPVDMARSLEVQKDTAPMQRELDLTEPQKIQEAVHQELSGGMGQKQRGGIDVQAIAEGLEKIKQKFQKFAVEVEPGAINPDSVMVRLKTPDGKLAGFVDFAKREDGTLVAENAQVSEGLRGHGAAQRMYLAAREAGYDIAPGRVQTALGNKMVERLQQNGLINKETQGQRFSAGDLNLKPLEGEQLPGYGRTRSLGGKQGGALDFEGITEGLRKLMPQAKLDVPAISNIVGKNAIPADPVPKDVVSAALKEGRDTNAYNFTKYTASGATLEGMSRKSALVEGVSRLVQNAQKRADLYINKTVHPVEQMFRKMNFPEIQKLGEAFKDEMFSGKRLTAEELQARGLNEKQLRAYAGMRKLFENTLEIQNSARVAQGLEPISAKESYLSSRWQGDFRQPVYDKQGRLKWYLAANSKLGLNKQIKELLADNPDLVVDTKKQHRVRVGGNKTDLQSMYTTMLDILGRDDPAVQKLKEAYEASVAAETGNTLGQQKHFERKGNIRGFVGDRPGTNAKKEALAMFQEQVQYAKNAYKWASLQEAGAKVKEILADEQLREQQPKNVEYAQEYFKNNLGHGEAKWVAALEDAFRETGVSPAVVDKAVGGIKSLFITTKLAWNAGYTLAGYIQLVNTIPHLVDTLVKHGGNPITAFGKGLAAGTAMAAGHGMNKLGGDFGAMTKDLPFLNEAFKYAEDNGITSRSIYDEAPIDQRGVVASTARVAGKPLALLETHTRSMAYMMFVSMLKDTKAFKDNHQALFQKAEELTNASMVDYRAGERPMGFSKLGVAGNALNTLQTFPVNLYNQYRYFGKEAWKGNVAPLFVMMAFQYAVAGAMGLPGFQDLDKLITWAKGHVPDNVYKEVKDFDPKLWMIENLGEAAVYGALSVHSDWLLDKVGIKSPSVSMTSRLSAPGAADMIQAPGGPIVDLVKQAGSVANMLADPTSTNVAQAVRDVTPTGLQGLMETKVFRDQNAIDRPDGTTLYKKATDLADRQGKYARTPEEESLRRWGLRSQREALSGDIDYKTNAIIKQEEDRSKSIVNKFYDAWRRGDSKRAAELQKLYVELNGHGIVDQTIEANMKEEAMTSLERRAESAGERISAIKELARINKIMKEHDKNNPRPTKKDLP